MNYPSTWPTPRGSFGDAEDNIGFRKFNKTLQLNSAVKEEFNLFGYAIAHISISRC